MDPSVVAFCILRAVFVVYLDLWVIDTSCAMYCLDIASNDDFWPAYAAIPSAFGVILHTSTSQHTAYRIPVELFVDTSGFYIENNYVW